MVAIVTIVTVITIVVIGKRPSILYGLCYLFEPCLMLFVKTWCKTLIDSLLVAVEPLAFFLAQHLGQDRAG